MPPKLSIVVPFYDVEDYFTECLESVGRQTRSDIEVIMVDDGSADSCTVIAKAFADRDPRFILVQQDNQGLGAARNTGARHATGEYLAFVDSDDVLAPRAYELLAASLDRTGSDFATGNVWRLDRMGVRQCPAQAEPLRETRLRTGVRESPQLVRDRIVCNKLFRRSFWTEHGFQFPTGLYEDSPVVIRAYCLASSVDVLSDHVYYWRRREGSITVRGKEFANLRARIQTATEVHRFLVAAAPELVDAWDEYALDIDLGSVIRALPELADDERAAAAGLGADYLALTEAALLNRMPLHRRLKLGLLGQRLVPELLELCEATAGGRWRGSAVRAGWRSPRWYVDSLAPALPLRLREITQELFLAVHVDEAVWAGDRLRIEGHARFRPADVRQAVLSLMLRNQATGAELKPQGTYQALGEGAHGFAFDLDPRTLRQEGHWTHGDWELHVTAKARGLSRTGRAKIPRLGRARSTEGRQVSRSMWLQPQCRGDEGFLLQVRKPRAIVSTYKVTGGVLELEGTLRGEWLNPQLKAVRTRGGETTTASVDVTDARFSTRLSLTELESMGGGLRLDGSDGGDIRHWPLSFEDETGKSTRLKWACDQGETTWQGDVHELVIGPSAFGNLLVVERLPRLCATEISWASGVLTLIGDYQGPGRAPDVLEIRCWNLRAVITAPVSWEAGRFATSISLPAQAGVWELFGKWPEELRHVVAAPELRRRISLEAASVLDLCRTDALRLRVPRSL